MKKNYLYKCIALIVGMSLITGSLCACSAKKSNGIVLDDTSMVGLEQEENDIEKENKVEDENISTTVDTDKQRNKEIQEYVESTYGIADDIVYGECVTHFERTSGSITETSETKIKEGSNVGAVFYKTVAPDKNKSGMVCVYLAEEKNGIFLNSAYSYDASNLYGGDSRINKSSIDADIKGKCYAIIEDNYIIRVNQKEKQDIVYNDQNEYIEEITVYQLTSNSQDVYDGLKRPTARKN